MFLYIVTLTRNSIYKKKSPLERHSAPFLGGRGGEVRLSNFIFFFKNRVEICGMINMMNTIKQ